MDGVSSPGQGDIRILLADDHAQVQRQLVARFKREADFDVVGVANNSIQTLMKTYEKKPDLLLMDPIMRDGLGLAALRQICLQLPETTVVVLTAFIDTMLAVQLREIGVNCVLTKGVSTSRLLSTIRSVGVSCL
jgi:DNA-binding NarL/FixJ family response regulator